MMNTNTDARSIKQIIKEELPILMKKDRGFRRWIVRIANEQIAEKTNKMETRTESRFDIVLEELRKDREAQDKKWEENQKVIRKLSENFEKSRKDFKADMKAQREEFREEMRKSRMHHDRRLDSTLGAIGSRWGVRSEVSFRNALKGILEDLGLQVEHFEEFDNECIVYDRPETVELDIIIKNGLLMLCELKASMSRADMFAFYKKTKYYEKKYHRKGDRLIVISPMVEDKAREVADEVGIKIYSFAEDIQEEFTT